MIIGIIIGGQTLLTHKEHESEITRKKETDKLVTKCKTNERSRGYNNENNQILKIKNTFLKTHPNLLFKS